MPAIAVFVFACLALPWIASAETEADGPSEESPQPVADEVACHPESGSWIREKDALELRAAYCQAPGEACADIATIQFGDEAGPVQFARTPARFHPCELVPQGSIGGFALYHDPEGKALLVVDGASLRVTQTFEQPAAGEIHRSPKRKYTVLAGNGHVTIVGLKDGEPVQVASEALEDILEVIWHPKQLVVAGATDVLFWPRSTPKPADGEDGDEDEKDKDSEEDGSSVGVLGKGGRITTEGLAPGQYAFEPGAVLYSFEEGRRLLWQPFDSEQRPRAYTLGSNDTLRDFGASDYAAAALISMPGDVEIIARSRSGLEARIEPRHVEIDDDDMTGTDGEPRDLLMGGGRWLVMDVGEARRSFLPIVTSDFSRWRQFRQRGFGTRGRMIHVDDDEVYIWHPKGSTALTARTQRYGKRRMRVKRDQLKPLGEKLEWARRLDRRLVLLKGVNGRHAFVDQVGSDVYPWPSGPTGTVRVGDPVPFGEREYAAAFGPEGTEASAVGWHLVSWKSHETIETSETVETPEDVEDAFPMAVRWFGYCLPGNACAPEITTADDVPTSRRDVEGLPTVTIDRDPVLPWAIFGVSVLLIIGVVLWRRDAWRSADPSIKRGDSPGGTVDEASRVFVVGAQVAYDSKNRRVPFEHDLDEFVHRGALTRWPLKLALSLLVGLGVALPVLYARLEGEDPVTWLGTVLAIAVPLGGLVWIAMSWGMWNRRHLLRFGKSVEAQWIDKQRDPKAVYVTPDGTYRIAGVDSRAALPIVLYDPKMQSYAAQYTGSSDLDPAGKRQPGEIQGTGRPLRPITWGAVIVLFVGCVVGGVIAMQKAFPEPLAESTLLELASDDPNGMLMPCLDLCDGDAECKAQCEHRQLEVVLEAADVEIEGTPEATAGDVRMALAERVSAWTEQLSGDAGTCNGTAKALPPIDPWPADLHGAFADAYGSADVIAHDETLKEAEAKITTARESVFQPLCDPEGACAKDRDKCDLPLKCSGPTRTLQAKVCGVYPHILPLSVSASTQEGDTVGSAGSENDQSPSKDGSKN